jgi:hypothetical protein
MNTSRVLPLKHAERKAQTALKTRHSMKRFAWNQRFWQKGAYEKNPVPHFDHLRL